MSSTITPAPINIIPTLDTQSILSDPRDILAYQLRYYCTAPLSVSNSTAGAMISIADTASRYQGSSETMVKQVTKDLTSVYNRFFPIGATIVNVSSSDNANGTYNLTIALAVNVNNTSYTLGADVSVNQNGILSLKWHPN